MKIDDEITTKEIQIKLQEMGIVLSKHTILTGRKHLGWTSHGTAYCQLMQDVKRRKMSGLDCSTGVSQCYLVNHAARKPLLFCCHKNEQRPRYKPQPKHLNSSSHLGTN